MFREQVTSTALTSPAADSAFVNIPVTKWNGDVSLAATLRAVIYPRMPDGAKLYSYAGVRSWGGVDCIEDSAEKISSVLIGQLPFDLATTRDTTMIHGVMFTDKDQRDAFFKKVSDGFCGDVTTTTYKPLEKNGVQFIREYFKSKLKIDVLCFVSDDLRSNIFIVDNLDMRKYHIIQGAILGAFPWYYDPKVNPPTEEELRLIRAVSDKNGCDEFKLAVSAIAEKYDFRTPFIRSALSEFEKRNSVAMLEGKKSRLNDINSAIDELISQMASYERQYEETMLYVSGLEAKINSGHGSTELMDFFLARKDLVLESVNDTEVVFGVKSVLSFFDKDSCTAQYEGLCDRYADCGISPKDMKALFKAIFIDEKIHINICAKYSFSIYGDFRALDGQHYDPVEYGEYMPNPHIQGYHCLGDNRTILTQLLREHNYIGVVEQLASSCKNLNFIDGTVMSEFMRIMYGSNRSYNRNAIVLPDGKVVTPENAIKWLRENEESENVEKTETEG